MTAIPGQGPKLILRRRRELAVDARGIYDSLKVTKDPDPITRMTLPARSASDVTKGLGLSRDVENSLERAVGDWLRSDNPIQFRGQVTRGLRQMIPNLQVRNEAMRRIAALHREASPGRRPAPGTEVIQKSVDPEGWHSIPGCDTGLRRQVPGGYVYTFPPADHAPPDDGMSALFSTPATNHPPDLLWCYPDDEHLEKAAQHKYIKRIPTGKQRPKYRYVYKVQGKGLVTDEHLVEGAKFKAKHVGAIGHFEVLAHDKAKGLVKVKHDESGKVAYVKKQDLTRMLASYHTKTPAPGKEARAKEKLPRTTMADLSRGDWQEVVGFQPTEQGALDLARSLKPDWDYAAIKQPTGYLVVAKQRATKAPGRSTIGSPVKIYLRGEQPAKATYTLMEADDLVASHDPVTFNVRKDYPEGVQEREYHRSKGEQQKVIRIAQDMKPEFLINNNPDGINGTPIITQDGVVLGGNARTLGVQRAYKTEPEESRKYKEHLAANARDYGFKPSDVRGMNNPVLVRRVKVDKKKLGDKHNDRLRLLGRRMNEGLTQGLDPRAEEVALARNFVNRKMLRPLIDGMDEGETLDGYLKSNRSRALVRGLWSAGILDNQNYSQFTYGEDAGSDEGLLNQEGRDRVERILVGRIVDSPTLLDRMSPTQRRALAASSVYILSAQQDGWDIGPKLKRAIQIDQSLQRMEKQFDAVGKPKLALRRFLSGKQTELGGISGMADEVKGDDMLRTLLTIVREKAGTRKMPSDFRGFAIRAKEDAKHNPEITGQSDLFGGAFAAKRMSPVEALDIEFGVSPQAAKAKSEREAAERAAKRAKKEEPFAASMPEPDLVKAVSDNKAVTRAAIYAEMLVDAAIATSSLKGKVMVDGPSIARKVLAELGDAMLKDPELARDQGRSPVDKKTVKGLVEAFVQMRS